MTKRLGFSYPFKVWFCRKAFLLGGCKGVSYLCGDNLLTPKDNRQNWQKNRWESLQNGLFTVKLTIRVCGKNPHGSIWPAPLVSTMEVQIFAKGKTITSYEEKMHFQQDLGNMNEDFAIILYFTLSTFSARVWIDALRCIEREKIILQESFKKTFNNFDKRWKVFWCQTHLSSNLFQLTIHVSYLFWKL